MIKLSRTDIESKYLHKPIFIKGKDHEEWCLVSEVTNIMPLHMLTEEEVNLYYENESNIEGIIVSTINCEEGYLLWIYFEKSDGWEAYSYE